MSDISAHEKSGLFRIQPSPLRSCLILGVAGAVLFLLLWPVAARFEPGLGPKMLAAAVVICTVLGVQVTLIEHAFFGDHSGMLTMATGMVFRMGVPLMICGIVTLQLGKEMGQSLARYLLVVYPITLLLETLLSVLHFNSKDESQQTDLQGLS